MIIIGLINNITRTAQALSSLASRITSLWITSIKKGFAPLQNILGSSSYPEMVQQALQELVPIYFEDVMIGLRVKNTLPYQLAGLANALSYYIDVDESEINEAINQGDALKDDVYDYIYNMVENQLSEIDDKELMCKDFWNGKELM